MGVGCGLGRRGDRRMIIDAVPLVNPSQLPPWQGDGWHANLDAFRLCAFIDDARAFRTNVPAIENLGSAAICGDAELFRLRRNSQAELWVAVRLRGDAHALVAGLRSQGPGPGTVTSVIENGVLTAVSVNTGAYRALAAYGGH